MDANEVLWNIFVHWIEDVEENTINKNKNLFYEVMQPIGDGESKIHFNIPEETPIFKTDLEIALSNFTKTSIESEEGNMYFCHNC